MVYAAAKAFNNDAFSGVSLGESPQENTIVESVLPDLTGLVLTTTGGFSDFANFISGGAASSNLKDLAVAHITDREGFRTDVYYDTEGYLTVGYGHKVLATDGLKHGDIITQERAIKFLNADMTKAFNAAKSQAALLGLSNDTDFIVTLTSVNYQLGVYWYTIHKRTWAALLAKKYDTAIAEISGSLWMKQTPVRANDFITAISNIGIGV